MTESKSKAVNIEQKVGDVLRNYLSLDKARSILNWNYKVSLDEGLDLTYKWFKENL